MHYLEPMTEEELRQSDLAALHLLFSVMGAAVIIGVVIAIVMMYRLIKHYGAGGKVLANVATFMTIVVNGVILSFAVMVLIVFGEPMSRYLSGWSIMLGLAGLEVVSLLKLIALWNIRSSN